MSRSIAPGNLLAHLLVPWLCLLAFGVIMVGSASVALDGGYLGKHLLYLVLALVAFAAAFAFPTTWLANLYWLAWLAAVVAAVLVLLPGIGHEVNGAQRWIRLGGFTVQASEVCKFGVAVFLAGYLARHYERIRGEPTVLFVPVCAITLIAALLIAEPDFGSAVVILTASILVLFLAGAQVRYFLAMGLLGVAAFAALVYDAPYRLERFIAFLDPWSVAYGSGYQLTQALIAFGRGELTGLGLGEGIQKLYYLPEAHNDFIFAVVAEELGSIGAIGLTLLLGYLVWRLYGLGRVFLRDEHMFAGFFCYFVALIFGLQLMVSLGVNTGVLPTKGLTLPFVSYGGNSLIICCALLAVVTRAYCNHYIFTPAAEPRKRRGRK